MIIVSVNWAALPLRQPHRSKNVLSTHGVSSVHAPKTSTVNLYGRQWRGGIQLKDICFASTKSIMLILSDEPFSIKIWTFYIQLDSWLWRVMSTELTTSSTLHANKLIEEGTAFGATQVCTTRPRHPHVDGMPCQVNFYSNLPIVGATAESSIHTPRTEWPNEKPSAHSQLRFQSSQNQNRNNMENIFIYLCTDFTSSLSASMPKR